MTEHEPYDWRKYITRCERIARDIDEQADLLCEFPERDGIVVILQRLQGLAADVRAAESPALAAAAIRLLRTWERTAPDESFDRIEERMAALRAALPEELRP